MTREQQEAERRSRTQHPSGGDSITDWHQGVRNAIAAMRWSLTDAAGMPQDNRRTIVEGCISVLADMET